MGTIAPARRGPAIVLLAAGRASRFGALKQLEALRGRSLVRRAAETALWTDLPVWVVTGADAERVAAEIDEMAPQRLRVVHNPDWARGMGGSIACGVRAARAEASALIVMLADQPLVQARDLLELLDEHAADLGAIVAADHGDGVIGPPCLFPAADFDALAALEGDRGARALLGRHPDRVRRVAMPHAALDIDTPDDFARAVDALRRHPSP